MRKKNASINGSAISIRGGIASALGQSHIVVLENFDALAPTEALSYNTITDAWTSYVVEDPAINFVNKDPLHWQGELLVLGSVSRSSDSLPSIWKLQVNGPQLHFGWANMMVVVVYLLSMVWVGGYFLKSNNSTNDYFRGGKHIPWWAAACSIYATMMSSLSFVGLPALVYELTGFVLWRCCSLADR